MQTDVPDDWSTGGESSGESDAEMYSSLSLDEEGGSQEKI